MLDWSIAHWTGLWLVLFFLIDCSPLFLPPTPPFTTFTLHCPHVARSTIMKALRKSLNASKETPHHQISTPLPSVSKPPAAIIPPQKVIRALDSYRSRAPQQLSFQKGDFFYVIRPVEDQGSWFEAHNPMTGARGLVPKAMFEEFRKGEAA